MGDAGRLSRRSLLLGTAGAVAVLGGGAAAGKYELDRHPGLEHRLLGCGHTPSIPHSDYVITRGTLDSTAMGKPMPWALARRRDAGASRQALILALPGAGGNELDFVTSPGVPGYATAAGISVGILSAGDVGSIYYHPRADGTDYLGFLVEELVPMIEKRFPLGGEREARAAYGWSMGGFGALLLAQQRPEFLCAAVGSSPAVFPSYHDAITGHPDTFDSAADWARWGLWDHSAQMGAVPVEIDCGDGDPFGPTAAALLRRIPGAVGAISSGCHDPAFWRHQVPSQLPFIRRHLGIAT